VPPDTMALPADIASSEESLGGVGLREAFTRAVLDYTTDAVVEVDDGGLVRSFNRAAERAFGWKTSDVIGQPVAVLMPSPDRRRRGDAAVPDTATGGVVVPSVGLRRDGSRFPMELSVAPFVVGPARHVAWFVRDVTERAHLEEQLRQSRKMDAMGQLAGGVAHDFNNLLTVINGWCEALSSGSPEERRSAIEQIRGAADRAATLTGQLLTFGRKAEVSPRVVDLNVVIDDVTKMLSRVIGEDVNLEVRPDPRPRFVRVDTGQMAQVLVNLAVNARDAMPKGGRLTITTSAYSLSAAESRDHGLDPGAYVQLRVTDTGIGMSPDVAARIFEPFYTTKGSRGTGLGLATVYGIVRQAGGAVWVRTRPGEGAAFSIVLPAVFEEPLVTEAPHRAEKERGSETILVVEDEPQVRTIAVNMLRARGYRVLVASTGQEATDLARAQESIDMVVTDVVMPNESGPDLVARLKAEHPAMPVLYVSGYAPDVLLDETAGDAAFLQKPYTGRQLAMRIREILDGNAASPSSPPVDPGGRVP
jgi:two-component system, cell cycle sensor histidine kinase and response regulator CckA